MGDAKVEAEEAIEAESEAEEVEGRDDDIAIGVTSRS
jgi:hypothetical protein